MSDDIEFEVNGVSVSDGNSNVQTIADHVNRLSAHNNLISTVKRADDYEHPVDTYRIIDDALGANAFSLLYHVVTDMGTPWYFTGTTYGDDEEDVPEHYSFGNSPDPDTTLGRILEATVMNLLDRAGIKINNLYRIRLGLIYPNGEKSMVHEAHIDSPSRHEVGLFYLTDSNGPTYIYKNTRDEKDRYDDSHAYYVEHVKDNLELWETFECKANRLVMFNGDHYHASSTPTDVGRRITLNFNYD